MLSAAIKVILVVSRTLITWIAPSANPLRTTHHPVCPHSQIESPACLFAGRALQSVPCILRSPDPEYRPFRHKRRHREAISAHRRKSESLPISWLTAVASPDGILHKLAQHLHSATTYERASWSPAVQLWNTLVSAK